VKTSRFVEEWGVFCTGNEVKKGASVGFGLGWVKQDAREIHWSAPTPLPMPRPISAIRSGRIRVTVFR
jgi:hypothetical protein